MHAPQVGVLLSYPTVCWLAAEFLFPESVALAEQRPLHELQTATLSARCGLKGSRQAAFRYGSPRPKLANGNGRYVRCLVSIAPTHPGPVLRKV